MVLVSSFSWFLHWYGLPTTVSRLDNHLRQRKPILKCSTKQADTGYNWGQGTSPEEGFPWPDCGVQIAWAGVPSVPVEVPSVAESLPSSTDVSSPPQAYPLLAASACSALPTPLPLCIPHPALLQCSSFLLHTWVRHNKRSKSTDGRTFLTRKKTWQLRHNNRRNNENIPFVFAYNQTDDRREIHSFTLWNSENDVTVFPAQILVAKTKHTRSDTEERNAMLNSHHDLCRRRPIRW